MNEVAADKKVLVVEDDEHIARLIGLHLEDLGCRVLRVGTAAEARFRSGEDSFDLVVLDLGLPDGDGLDVCRHLRERRDWVPVLILTARTEEVDRVLGLEMGADDYLTKPFSVRELAARVKAIFRRVEMLAGGDGDADEAIRLEGLEIDAAKRRVAVDDVPVELTAREFDLLLQFARNPGRVYTRSELLDRVWGYGAGCYEHTVNSHINRLRSKIEPDSSEPYYIQTVWGVGYRFRDPAGPGA